MASRRFTDTTDFYAIEAGDEILIGDRCYAVIGNEKERRFGIEDPKFWVKRAVEVATGERKIIKLSYFEAFDTSVGGVKIRCFRSPDKEAQILKLTRQHPAFMHGQDFRDQGGNNIRVLDVVRGANFMMYLHELRMPMKNYLSQRLGIILALLTDAFEAIAFLHHRGLRHGDIRNDHLIMERKTGRPVWIDFDYDFRAEESPFSLDIFGLGNLLLYATGKGFHHQYAIENELDLYGNLCERLSAEDFAVLDRRRLVNLRKLFPAIPYRLNDILMHFSMGTSIFYESVDEILEDLRQCLKADFNLH